MVIGFITMNFSALAGATESLAVFPSFVLPNVNVDFTFSTERIADMTCSLSDGDGGTFHYSQVKSPFSLQYIATT